jgi:hypothetical protein
MFSEKRSEPRVRMAMPIRVGGTFDAVTRDISPSGIYVRLRGRHAIEGPLDFEIDREESNMKFVAQGEVVRVEHRRGFTGIAVRLLAGRLASIA